MTSSALTCGSLLLAHAEAWQAATVHPFLQQCQQGTITAAQFNTWLVQDYLFVVEFTRLAARLLAAAPLAHFDPLMGGMAAIRDELLWFQAKAEARSLDLAVEAQPTCLAYCTFMRSLATYPYAVQATAFWAIERAYNQGWQGHSPMPAPYTEFADRWGNKAFSEYVTVLEQQADEAIATASSAEQKAAERAFLAVAQLEKEFWQMAFLADR
ncbi:MAG: TenA family transcriptional regulator [Cyanobacteria bacterium J06614_10]